MKQYGKTLILLVLVVIAGFIAWRLSEEPTSEELEERRTALLPDLKTDRVASVAIREGDRQLVCRRVGDSDDWRISTPIEGRADRWEVEDILNKLEGAEKIWSIPAAQARDADLGEYGLDEPRRTVTITERGQADRTWTVLIGDTGATGGGVYVKLEDQEGLTAIEENVVDSTAVTLADVRSKKLAPRINTYDLRTIAASAEALEDDEAYELKCEKSGDAWEIKQPFFDLADSNNVEGIATDLYSHRIKKDDFVSDDPTEVATYGLDDPVLTLTVEGADEKQEFAVSAVEGEDETRYYAMYKAETAIVQITEDLFDDLHKSPDDLRERSLIANLVTGDVKKIALAGPEGDLVIEDADAGWTIQGDEPVEADEDVIDDFLKALKGAKVQEFVANETDDPAQYGLSEKRRTRLTLEDEGGEALAELEFGKSADEEGVYARRADYPPVLAAAKKGYHDMVARGRLAFLDRQILDEPRSEAVRVALENPEGQFEVTREDSDEDWELLRPARGPADQSAVGRVLGVFANLEAEAFAAEDAEDLSEYGLDSPALTAEVTYRGEPPEDAEEEEGEEAEPEERTQRLLVGDETSDPAEGHYAMLEGDGRVFVLAGSDADDLRDQLGSRQVSKAADITALTFQKGETTAKFNYDDEEDAWTDADGAEVHEQTASALQDARRMLRDFRATEVADYTVSDPGAYGFDQPFLTVQIDTETVSGKLVTVGKETEDGRYVKGPVSSFALVASESQVKKLTAPLEPPTPPEEPEPESEEQPEEAAE